LIHKWRNQLLELGSELFERGAKSSDDKLLFEHEQLLKKVGQMSLEIDFLKKAYANV
jgi:transposase